MEVLVPSNGVGYTHVVIVAKEIAHGPRSLSNSQRTITTIGPRPVRPHSWIVQTTRIREHQRIPLHVAVPIPSPFNCAPQCGHANDSRSLKKEIDLQQCGHFIVGPLLRAAPEISRSISCRNCEHPAITTAKVCGALASETRHHQIVRPPGACPCSWQVTRLKLDPRTRARDGCHVDRWRHKLRPCLIGIDVCFQFDLLSAGRQGIRNPASGNCTINTQRRCVSVVFLHSIHTSTGGGGEDRSGGKEPRKFDAHDCKPDQYLAGKPRGRKGTHIAEHKPFGFIAPWDLPY